MARGGNLANLRKGRAKAPPFGGKETKAEERREAKKEEAKKKGGSKRR